VKVPRHWLLLISIVLIFSINMTPIEAARTIRVGWCILPGYQEYHEELDKSNGKGIDAPGVYSGYSYDYLKTIANYTGWQYQFVKVPSDQLLDALENGKLDLVCMMTKTAAREARFLYPDASMGDSSLCLVCRMDDERFTYGDYASLNGIKVALNLFSMQSQALSKFSAAYNFHPVSVGFNTYQEAEEALAKGTVDACLVNLPFSQTGYKILLASRGIDFYIITNKQNPALRNSINSAIQQIKYYQPDFDNVLSNKYFTNATTASFAFSKDEKAYLEAVKTLKQTITVQFNPSWKPIEYKDSKTGEIKGVMAEIFELLSKETGLRFKFVAADAESQDVVPLGESVDMEATLADDLEWAEAQDAFATQPVFNAPIVMVSQIGEENGIVALPKGYHLAEAVKERLKKGIVTGEGNKDSFVYHEYNTVEECVEAVRQGQAGRTYINAYELNYYANIGKLTNLKVQNATNFFEPISIGISKKAPRQLRTIIGKSLKRIPTSKINDIIIKNTGIQQTRSMSIQEFVYLHPLGVVALAVLLAFLCGIIIFFYYNSRKNEQQRLALEAANNAKGEFLNRVSHDIRTPMNAIIGLTEIAKLENTIPAINGYLHDINVSSKYLLSLVNDVLDMSKIEKDSFTLQPEVLTPQRFLETLNSTVEVLAEQAGVKLSTVFEGHVEPIYVDVMRYNQIFINLLDNAIKHTPAGGTVRYEAHCSFIGNGMLHMTNIVADNGIGISAEFLPHVFEAFSQEENKDGKNMQGTGLGLAIVKRLVEVMGGTIAVSSEKGKGTTFTIELDVPLATQQQILQADSGRKGSPTFLVFNQAAHRGSADLHGKHILAAEDNLINQKVIGKLLIGGGMVFDIVNNGRECVEKLKSAPEHYYDAILMDVRMPVLDGMGATKEIRSLARADKDIPIVALTADAYTDTQEKAREVGMDAFITKPVYPGNLYGVLKNILS